MVIKAIFAGVSIAFFISGIFALPIGDYAGKDQFETIVVMHAFLSMAMLSVIIVLLAERNEE